MNTLYDIHLTIEMIKDGSDYHYMASSPDLPNLIVVGDTIDEVLALAPQVAQSLIASMKASGDTLPTSIKAITSLPYASHVLVPA